jgi:LacI family transcriptional regulator
MKPITIKDIAQELGISVSTVSRALQDHPDISQRTKDLVQDAAKRLNYKPNLMASNLRTCKNTTIGVVIPELNHHFFSSVLDGIEQTANEAGYNVLICQTREDLNKEVQAVHTLMTSRVAGILLGVSKQTANLAHLQEIIDQHIPLILYDRPCPSLRCDQVISDDHRGAYEAVEYLIQRGCKRIMCFTSSMQLEVSLRRYQGWRDALMQHNMPFGKDLVYECDTRIKALELAPQILQSEDRPDAIFCVNDDTAVGVLQAAKSIGMNIPDDLSICGFSDAPICSITSPLLTTVEQHGEEIGRRAMGCLLNRLAGDHSITHTDMVSANLIVRGTTK